MLTIAIFYWVDPARQRSYKFDKNDIRIFCNMIRRNVTIPHRVVCVTHVPELMDDIVECIPLDDSKHIPNGCTAKLMVWRRDVAEIFGSDRICVMDIDTVIVDNIDPILDRPEPTVFWKNPNFSVGGRRGFYQGSIQLLTAGAKPELYEDFDPLSTPRWLNRRFGGAEQCWISERLNTSYPEPGWEWNEPFWDENDGIYGAGRLVGGRQDNGVQSELPENARIVFLPGDRKPGMPNVNTVHPWIERYWW